MRLSPGVHKCWKLGPSGRKQGNEWVYLFFLVPGRDIAKRLLKDFKSGRAEPLGFVKRHGSTPEAELRARKIRVVFETIDSKKLCSKTVALDIIAGSRLHPEDKKALQTLVLAGGKCVDVAKAAKSIGVGKKYYYCSPWNDEIPGGDIFIQAVKQFMAGFADEMITLTYAEYPDSTVDLVSSALANKHAYFRAEKDVVRDVTRFVLYGKGPSDLSKTKNGAGSSDINLVQNIVRRTYRDLKKTYRGCESTHRIPQSYFDEYMNAFPSAQWYKGRRRNTRRSRIF